MLLIPLLGANSATGAFLGVVACDDAYDEAIYAVARVVWKEARSEPEDGKRMVVQVIRNRAEHYGESVLETTRRGMAWDGELEPGIVKLVAEEMGKPVRYPYKFWINFDRATDRRQIRLARTAKDAKIGQQIADHFFY